MTCKFKINAKELIIIFNNKFRIIFRFGFCIFLLGVFTATAFLCGIHSDEALVSVPVHYVDYIAAMITIPAATILALKTPNFYFYQIIGFCVIAQYLGMMLNFYDKFPWWDIFLHFTSGVILASLSYYIYTFLCEKLKQRQNIIIGIWFATFTSIACAALWEIYEYTADTFFGFDCQGLTVVDTMTDIVAGTTGAILSGIALFFYVKNRKKSI